MCLLPQRSVSNSHSHIVPKQNEKIVNLLSMVPEDAVEMAKSGVEGMHTNPCRKRSSSSFDQRVLCEGKSAEVVLGRESSQK